jgi:hypothetical protein
MELFRRGLADAAGGAGYKNRLSCHRIYSSVDS